jgi:RNA polymerase sigma-70 factor (ECF subfamily)
METVQAAADVLAPANEPSDGDVVERVIGGDRACFEILMRRHNQRIYRVVRAVLKDEQEVEDAMQQAYVNAFVHLHQFERRSQFSTWLTRIALNEAFLRRKKREVLAIAESSSTRGEHSGEFMESMPSPRPDPERQAYAGELTRALEQAVDALPETYRSVFMLRDVEGLSTIETGEGLGIGEEAVKTRLHRARAMVRRAVAARIGGQASEAFQFHAPRCDRVVAAVLARMDRL